MTEKIINKNLSEKLKEKAGHKIPEDFDFSSIGRIDLNEAEKIANEEIVFLSEEDLIDGLEDFELIPVKSPEKINHEYIEKHAINDVPISEVFTEEIPKEVNPDEILFEDFSSGKEEHEESPAEEPISGSEVFEDEIEPVEVENIEESVSDESSSGIKEESSRNEHFEDEAIDESDEFIIGDESDVIELDLDEMMSEKSQNDTISDESDILKKKINEGNFDNQLDDIIKTVKSEEDHEFIPGIYDDSTLDSNIKFIDDSYVEKKSGELTPVFESDPLTENLVRMIDVSDGKLQIIDDIAEPHDRIEYILDDTKIYDAESLALLFKEERFMDDSDFDFIDNAIIRDDYTVYIQEIDEYLKSREALSGSEVYEILGLLPEEIQDIDEKLFGEYYKELDDEYELEFISPELSFFDRGFVKKKELSYFIKDAGSFFDDEKKSIEDDITSESAIIFEEDIDEIKRLLDESYVDLKEEETGSDLLEIQEITEIHEIQEAEAREEELPEIIDITDRIIILEDKYEIERITAEFPEKRDELVKLLSYLDGLLEKLPEESIRKFAESEYFDLYAKVLKEIGK